MPKTARGSIAVKMTKSEIAAAILSPFKTNIYIVCGGLTSPSNPEQWRHRLIELEATVGALAQGLRKVGELNQLEALLVEAQSSLQEGGHTGEDDSLIWVTRMLDWVRRMAS
ncbi:MAG TPA: hypothetical protein VI953_01525 [Candidatus Paceibacterota bacterium]